MSRACPRARGSAPRAATTASSWTARARRCDARRRGAASRSSPAAIPACSRWRRRCSRRSRRAIRLARARRRGAARRQRDAGGGGAARRAARRRFLRDLAVRQSEAVGHDRARLMRRARATSSSRSTIPPRGRGRTASTTPSRFARLAPQRRSSSRAQSDATTRRSSSRIGGRRSFGRHGDARDDRRQGHGPSSGKARPLSIRRGASRDRALAHDHRHRRGRRPRPPRARSSRGDGDLRRRAASGARRSDKAAQRAWPSPFSLGVAQLMERRGAPTVVLASGDPFFFGVGATLAEKIAPEEIFCLPAPSTFALVAARLAWSQQDCALLSLHGRAFERVTPHLQPGRRLIALSWDETTPARLATHLAARGFGRSVVHVLENLGGPRERIRSAAAAEFALEDISPLNAVAVELVADRDARVIPLTPGLPDEWFEHDGQLTKRDVRAVTLAALAPRKGERLWDIGAGAGSSRSNGCWPIPPIAPSRSSATRRAPRASRETPRRSAFPISRLCAGRRRPRSRAWRRPTRSSSAGGGTTARIRLGGAAGGGRMSSMRSRSKRRRCSSTLSRAWRRSRGGPDRQGARRRALPGWSRRWACCNGGGKP